MKCYVFSAQKESWDFLSGFMCGGLYWVGVDFTATFCVGLTNPIDGKEQNHIFLFMFVHSVLLVLIKRYF